MSKLSALPTNPDLSVNDLLLTTDAESTTSYKVTIAAVLGLYELPDFSGFECDTLVVGDATSVANLIRLGSDGPYLSRNASSVNVVAPNGSGWGSFACGATSITGNLQGTTATLTGAVSIGSGVTALSSALRVQKGYTYFNDGSNDIGGIVAYGGEFQIDAFNYGIRFQAAGQVLRLGAVSSNPTWTPSSGTMGVAGKFKCNTLNVTSLPTSASGLSSGDIWNDSGTLKVVS